MLPEQQQRILGYFIEEANDHLNTIEQGLLSLQNTLQDPEMVNEIFRAAHSIKGGAAMLGLNSIQRTAHYLEDFFKILKETSSIQVNQNIESLFLQVFDTLQALLTHLQSESGLTEDVSHHQMSQAEPVFAALEQALELQVHQAGGGMGTEEILPATQTMTVPTANPSWLAVFENTVPEVLRQMLQMFKQPETPQTREQLGELCHQLAQLGEQFDLSGWCTLCETAEGAIANPDNSYRTLAPIIIKELKQAQELVLTSSANEIRTCEQLQALSIATFLFDREETSTSIQLENNQYAEMTVVAEPKIAEPFTTIPKDAEAEFSTLDFAGFSTEEKIGALAPEDDLSSLFASKSVNSDLLYQATSEFSDFFDVEDDGERIIGQNLEDNFLQISSEETTAFSTLFSEAQDISLNTSIEESAFCDLFKSTEANTENLDISEVNTSAILIESDADLSNFWAEEEPDTSTPIEEFDPEELSLTLGAEELFAASSELMTLPIEESETTDCVNSEIDFTWNNSSDCQKTDNDPWLTEPKLGLTNATDAAQLNLSSDELDFSSVTDEGEFNLYLLEETTAISVEEDATELMSEFNLGSEGLDLTTNSPDAIAQFDLGSDELDLTNESADLFSSTILEDELGLNLLEETTAISTSEDATEALAQFDLGSNELNFTNAISEDELSLDLLEETTASTEEDATELISEFDLGGDALNLTTDSADAFFSAISEDELSLDLLEETTASTEEDVTDAADFALGGDDIDFSNTTIEEELGLNLLEETTASTEENATDLMSEFNLSDDALDFTTDSVDLLSNNMLEDELGLNLLEETTAFTEENVTDAAGFALGGDELGFSSDSVNLLSNESLEELELNLLEETTAFTEENATDTAEFALSSNELDFGSDLVANLLSDVTNEDELGLDLLEEVAEISIAEDVTELMSFGLASDELDSIGELADLLSDTISEDELSGTLFEEASAISDGASALELMAEFDLSMPIDTTLVDESIAQDMAIEEICLQPELTQEDSAIYFESELEAHQELPTAAEEASEQDDFTELEALLEEESTSDLMATAEALLDLNAPTVAPVAEESGEDQFDDLEKLLQEIPANTANATPVQAQPQQIDDFNNLEKLLQETPAKPVSIAPVEQPQASAATNARRPAFEQMMRVPVKHLDNIGNLVGELVVYRNSLEQDQERLRQFLENLLHQVQQLGDVGTRMQELYERSLLEASLLNSRQGSRLVSSEVSAPSDRHVTGINFDSLEMDRFTGFHTLAQEMIELIVRVREASSDIEFVTGETEQVARQFRQVTTQLQEGITRSRMLPFGQIADRLPRAVRDISLKYGKQAELQIDGQDTLIDKVILEQLYDPMTHLVNNAITHGIESAEERSAKGKSPVGQITVRAFHQGNQTIIAVSDDGAGIDPERVKAKAIKNGLITPEAAENMSRQEVYNLLFQPGFSTKDQVDQFAGRGIGMDVVLTSLKQMRGSIHTDSTLGKGTTFTIRLPLTLSICKALCCLSDKARIAFPMDGVEQMIDISPNDVVANAQGQACIPWRNSLLPFRPVKELLSFNRQISRGNIYGSNRDEETISIVVLRSADIFVALQVDQVLGEQEIVIKQFEAPAPKPVGIAGATILGDGRIMPIADVLELIDLSIGRIQADNKGTWGPSDAFVPPQIAPVVKTEPLVLIVDDSITVRELLSMTFTNAGYRVEQARDGQEAWDKLRDGLPCDLIFCDIEMPRMDGLELLSRMQKEPRLSGLPIAMLTSRGSDRHRQMALQLGASGYFTKPYLEEALLDGAQRMLKGEVLLASSSNA